MSSLQDKRNFDLGYDKGWNDCTEKHKQKLREILSFMKGIPDKRLPLGKNAWLHEWNCVEQMVKEVLGEEKKEG